MSVERAQRRVPPTPAAVAVARRAVVLLVFALGAPGVPMATAQPGAGVAPLTQVADVPDRSGGLEDAVGDAAADTAEDDSTAGQRADPWEPFNRAIWRFNQDLDQGLVLPWTDAYVTLVPEVARTAIRNFFANAQDAWSAVNNLLQARPDRAVAMTMRFVANSFFGIFGLIDIATDMGMPRTPADFGQTLGVWGVQSGPYLVLPLVGPSTLRDAAGLPLDLMASPYYAVDGGGVRAATTVLGVVNTRAQLLGATEALDEIALDKYAFVRDVFLRRRLNAVFDGDPPEGYDIDSWRRPAPP